MNVGVATLPAEMVSNANGLLLKGRPGAVVTLRFTLGALPQVFDKLAEEVEELRVEIAAGDRAKAREELGDLLFVVANLARKLDVEPEDALRAANAKFVRRFGFIEAALASEGRTPDQSTLEEMDRLWDAAKVAEKAALHI